MELYKRFPKLCIIWSFVEIVCFGGIIFGWGSLVFVLKEEGFYHSECQPIASSNHIQGEMLITNTSVNNISYNPIESSNGVLRTTFANSTANVLDGSGQDITKAEFPSDCVEQESKLNLWFSIAVGFMYLGFAAVGYIIRILGTRNTRLLFIVIYVIGTLSIAFASPVIPWLLCPGLCCIGIAGLAVLATNLQVANLYPKLRSTIVAIFTGLFDFSSIIQQIVKVVHERGIERKYSYIFISALFFSIVGFSTLCFHPRGHITEPVAKSRKKISKPDETKTEPSDVLLTEKDGNGAHSKEDAYYNSSSYESQKSHLSLRATLLSAQCLFHLFWLCIHALRFVTFIGLLNVWLKKTLNDEDERVSGFLGLFSYITMGAIGTALITGFLYDWQRRKFIKEAPLNQKLMPVLLPMLLTIVYSLSTTVMTFFESEITLYLAFVTFTFFRSSLFTVAVAFIGDAFPVDYFGVLFGFVQFAAGVAGLIQYPIFEWYEGYPKAAQHVSILLLILQLTTLIHPVILFIRCRREKQYSFNSSS
ncbi:hypothetical protein CHS0354_005035 [Potamilus streckersoni]|uniref:Solute carrier family 43 member 3 n=1 Tax=Potamilus streckersoni TaxID=2493646 RepID=A0AAE0SSE1_9BIVA|nr:hypothetical protein CHS0354_005035 [Potamilus streckersoni]